MFLFSKVPAVWYILRPGRAGEPYKREGPYKRETIGAMYAAGSLDGGVLLWTNERIFYDTKNRKSRRLIRVDQWLKFDDLPDPGKQHIMQIAQRWIPSNPPPSYSVIPPSSSLPQPPPHSGQPGYIPAPQHHVYPPPYPAQQGQQGQQAPVSPHSQYNPGA